MVKDNRLDDMLAELAGQHDLMDLLSGSVTADYRARGGKVYCAKGCSNCCSLAVNCTFAEALLIAESLDLKQSRAVAAYAEKLCEKVPAVPDLKGYLRMHRHEMGGCPFLDDGACGIYRVRPVSCRALLSTLESCWCGADFSELSAEDKQLFLKSLDRSVTAFPMHYMAATGEVGAEMERLAATGMNRAFGFALYGSMPALVHLIQQHGILDALSAGHEQVEALIRSAFPDNRFLVEIGVS